MDIPTKHSSKDLITMTFTQTNHVLKHRSFTCTKSGTNIQISKVLKQCQDQFSHDDLLISQDSLWYSQVVCFAFGGNECKLFCVAFIKIY